MDRATALSHGKPIATGVFEGACHLIARAASGEIAMKPRLNQEKPEVDGPASDEGGRPRRAWNRPTEVGQAAKATRTMLIVLLLLVIGVVLAAAIVFSDPSRVFLLKFTAAAVLSVIPGWVYLQFIRNKGPSLYDEYVLNLFRLEIDSIENLPAPPEHTTWYQKWKEAHDSVVDGRDIRDNLYRRKFEALYGPTSVSTIGLTKRADRLSWRERTETVGPVVMATIVIALGWALVLQPELLRGIDLLGARRELSRQLILPAEALRFAFIGAYALTILDLGRRYFRDDLMSAAYLSATTRIVFASAVVVAADAAGWAALLSPAQINAAAFFIGFFPRAGFTWLRALLPARLQAAIPQLESDYPLRDLEGLNIWYESRLIEEGIESMQNLCSASLVDLMLKTRLPIMRVVDWLDQAYLYLHLPKGRPDEPRPNLQQLRILGIRTATDLERVWKQSDRSAELELLLGRALVPSEPEKGGAVISSLLLSLEGEPNLWHVRAFRKLKWLREEHGAVVTQENIKHTISQAVEEALGEPPLVNYHGTIAIWVDRAMDDQLSFDSGSFDLVVGEEYSIGAVFGRSPDVDGPRGTIAIDGGVDSEEADFEISYVCPAIEFGPETSMSVPTDGRNQPLRTSLTPLQPGNHRVSAYVLQRNRLIQVIRFLVAATEP